MVKPVEGIGANLVICQSGFNDEMNHLPMQNGLFSIRWAEGPGVKVCLFDLIILLDLILFRVNS